MLGLRAVVSGWPSYPYIGEQAFGSCNLWKKKKRGGRAEGEKGEEGVRGEEGKDEKSKEGRDGKKRMGKGRRERKG